eukprot:2700867-Amphidinium_carterae.1
MEAVSTMCESKQTPLALLGIPNAFFCKCTLVQHIREDRVRCIAKHLLTSPRTQEGYSAKSCSEDTTRW